MQVFGELEYIFGCIKITFIVMLIMLMLILGIMKRELLDSATVYNTDSTKARADAYYTQTIGSRCRFL